MNKLDLQKIIREEVKKALKENSAPVITEAATTMTVSIPGAFIAALIISEVKAICVWIGLVNIFGVEVSFSKLTLVVDFLVMAIVLVIRPWGLLGRPQISKPHSSELETSFNSGKTVDVIEKTNFLRKELNLLKESNKNDVIKVLGQPHSVSINDENLPPL